ncbi:MAG: murein biosynthesis integral membrane protein MurJ [Coriobacteriales bacterium]|nr:murein biosynthesis integral membrane protein MurJ [Coriobacteriales bacterium]
MLRLRNAILILLLTSLLCGVSTAPQAAWAQTLRTSGGAEPAVAQDVAAQDVAPATAQDVEPATAQGVAPAAAQDVAAQDVEPATAQGVAPNSTSPIPEEIWEAAWERTPAPEIIKGFGNTANALHPVLILLVPNLQWNMISARNTPGLYNLIGDGALANINAPFSLASRLESNPALAILSLEKGRGIAFYDAQINILRAIVPVNWVFIVTSAPALAGSDGTEDLHPCIIRGANLSGYATSSTTQRSGLITGGDVLALINNLNAPGNSTSAVNEPDPGITAEATRDNIDERRRTVDAFASFNKVMTETKEVVSHAFLIFVFVTFSMAVLLLVLGRREKKDLRALLIPIVRILCLVVLSYPPATFLMFLFLPAAPTPDDLYLSCILWTAGISFIVLLIGYYSRWVNSLIALFALSIGVIVLGQLVGGPLDMPGYMTYEVTIGSRYYGMGNEQCAVFFGSWITLSGLLINRFPKARWMPAFRTWGYAAISLALLVVACSPNIGASFGPLTWGVLGIIVTWWVFSGHRIRWWLIVGAILLAAALALGALYLDVSFNPASHMQWVIPSMQQGFPTLVHDIINGVWRVSSQTISQYVPAVAIFFLVLVVVLLFVIRVFKPGSYREFWQRNAAFSAVYSVCFVMSAITFFLEDSGVFTPAVLLLYPLAALVWLVCDLHSWHLRMLATDGTPLTLGELQRRTLAVIAPMEGVVDKGREQRVDKEQERAMSSPVETETETSPSHPSVRRSTATMATMTMLSRITGFLRTWAMAFALGNTMLTSAYSVANNLPNMLYELVAGGVLTTAFLPLYLAQLEKRGREGASNYASNLLSIGIVVLGSVALLATIFAPQVIFTQTFMTQTQTAQTAVFFFRFFAIQMVFYGVGSIISGLLNAHRSFLWPAFGPVFNNICVIITFFGYPLVASMNWSGGMVWLGIGTTLGVIAMFAVQIPALLKLKIRLRFKIDLHDPALKDTLRMALPATIFIVLNLIVVSVQNAFALNVTAQGPATIAYAWLWFALPYGVLGVALSTALYTEMSEASAAGNWPRFRSNVRLGMRTTIFMIIPLALILFTLSNQLAGLYHAGQFNYEDVLTVARVLACWCLALPFYAVYMFIYRAFSSLRDLSRFIIVDACGRVVQASLYATLTTGFGNWAGLGLVGIPIADLITYSGLTVVMSIMLRRHIGSFGLRGIIVDGLKIVVAALLAVAIPFVIAFGSYDQTIAISLTMIVSCGLFSLSVFYLLCRLFKVPEVALVNDIMGVVVRRIRKHEDEGRAGSAIEGRDESASEGERVSGGGGRGESASKGTAKDTDKGNEANKPEARREDEGLGKGAESGKPTETRADKTGEDR